jgi:hypothetical protein
MRMEASNRDTKQVQLRIHPDEASHLLRELQESASLLEDEGESLTEALEGAGVEAYRYPAHFRMVYRELDPALPHQHRRDTAETLD